MKAAINVQLLAELVRIDVGPEELTKLEHEIPGILAFVDQIQSVQADMPKAVSPSHRNIMRNDDNEIESGTYTEVLIGAAPASEKGQIAVKQVVSRTK